MEKKPHGPIERRIERAVDRVRRMVVMAVLVLMALAVLLATVDLVMVFAGDLRHGPSAFGGSQLIEIFGLLLLVLVGIELLETVHGVLERPPVIHAELVLLAVLIATGRSVVLVKEEGADPGKLVALAALLVALSISIALLRWGRRRPPHAPE